MNAVLPVRAAALTALLIVAPLGAAQAESWLMGDPLRTSLADPEPRADLSLGFTPRLGALSLDGVRLSLSMGAEGADAAPHHGALAELDERNDALGNDSFVVGGALALEGVVLSAQIAQRNHLAGPSETVRAAVRAGNVTTALSYTDGIAGGERERFALGTAFEAAPGISVGADLSLDDGIEAGDERDAAGVLRFKLEF